MGTFKRVCEAVGGLYGVEKGEEECLLPNRGSLAVVKTPKEFSLSVIIPRTGKRMPPILERKKFTPEEEFEEFKGLQAELEEKGATLEEIEAPPPRYPGKYYVPRRGFTLTDKIGEKHYFTIAIGRGEIPYTVKLRGLAEERGLL